MSRILIVDDEPQITRMLRASLVSHGYDVVSAANGMEGLATFEKSRPDLVITDLSMPVMDGLALTEEIRRISRTPIIVLSVRAAETITSPSLSTCPSCWRGCVPSSGERCRRKDLLRRLVRSKLEISYWKLRSIASWSGMLRCG